MTEKTQKTLEHLRQLPNNMSGDGSVWVIQFKKVMAEVIERIAELEKGATNNDDTGV